MFLGNNIFRNTLIIFCIPLLLAGCGDAKKQSKEKITQGLMELEKGNSKGAKTLFEEAIKKDPENAMAYYYHGSLIFNLDMKNHKAAMDELTKAIMLDSAFADAWATRGQIKFYMDDKDGACEDWRKAESLGKPNMYDKTRYCP